MSDAYIPPKIYTINIYQPSFAVEVKVTATCESEALARADQAINANREITIITATPVMAGRK